MAPACGSLAIMAGAAATGAAKQSDAQHFGILGIMLVLAIGLAMLIPVKSGLSARSALVHHAVGE
jgi:UMF1 family MFS transporter